MMINSVAQPASSSVDYKMMSLAITSIRQTNKTYLMETYIVVY